MQTPPLGGPHAWDFFLTLTELLAGESPTRLADKAAGVSLEGPEEILQVFEDCQDSSVTLSRYKIHYQHEQRQGGQAEGDTRLARRACAQVPRRGAPQPPHRSCSAPGFAPCMQLHQIAIVLNSIVWAATLFLIHCENTSLQTSQHIHHKAENL